MGRKTEATGRVSKGNSEEGKKNVKKRNPLRLMARKRRRNLPTILGGRRQKNHYQGRVRKSPHKRKTRDCRRSASSYLEGGRRAAKGG